MSSSKNNKIITINRNNTDFPLKLTQVLREMMSSSPPSSSTTELAFLKYHQNLVRHFSSGVKVISTLPGSEERRTARGLLIYHQMGTGKTLQAIAIAMEFLEINEERQSRYNSPPKDIIVILAKSLRDNFILSIKKYIDLRARINPSYHLSKLSPEDLNRWISERFNFVTLLASNMVKQVGNIAAAKADIDISLEEKVEKIVDAGSLDGKIVIIDEVQNLFRAITNGSKGASMLYNLIMAARDLRLFLLSGTPISNNPFETVACFNMLAGEIVLPEGYGDFKKYFIDAAKNTIKNKGVFQNRITGLVSYVGNISDGKNQNDALAFPEEKETRVLYVPMSRRQYSYYIYARDKEKAEGTWSASKGKAAPMTKPKSNKSSSYRQRSRQVSNYCPPDRFAMMKFSEIDVEKISPEEITSPKFEKLYSLFSTEHKDQLSVVYSQFAGAGGLASLMKFLSSKGCKLHPLLKGIGNMSALLNKDDLDGDIIDKDADKVNIISHSGGIQEDNSSDKFILKFERKGDIKDIENEMSAALDNFSKGRRILEVVKELSFLDGIARGNLIITFEKSDVHIGGGDGRIFAIISGEVPQEIRTKIISEFNSKENSRGEIISMLLITRTGAEGLDLKRVRAIFILEPPWTYSLISQIKARGVRSGSHVDLPPADRNVQTYMFIATKPDADPAEEMLRKAIIGDRIMSDLPELSILSNAADDGSSASVKAAAGIEELMTTDMTLYYEALRERSLIDSFLDAIKESSIECEILGHVKSLGLHCRQCNPTNSPLFTNNIDRDCVSPDPCSLLVEQKVKAKEIEYGDRKYYYVPDLKSLYGYSFFEYSDKVGKYLPADVSGVIDELLAAIEQKKS